MKVKIYREPENEILLLDESALEEYNNLITELGLRTKSQESQNTPPVYPSINNAQEKMLKAICPTVSKVEAYIFSTIPLDVLKVLQFCKENNHFDWYEIWSANTEPDPLLVGCSFTSEESKQNGYHWNSNKNLIAMWGDEALELPQLYEKGFNSLCVTLKDTSTKMLSFCEHALKHPESVMREYLKNGNLPSFDLSNSSNPF